MALSPHVSKNWRVPHLDIEHGEIKLDIGCGVKQLGRGKNFVGIDIEDHGQKVLWDVDNGLPFSDSSCKEVFMHHALEHFKNPSFVLNECWRVLRKDFSDAKKGGFAEIIVPYYKEPEAYTLHHTHFFSKDTFKHLEQESLDRRYGIKSWTVLELSVGDEGWISDFNQPTVYAKLTPKKGSK